MPKTKIDKELVIREAAHIANKIGIENLSLKTLASQLGVKSPSLYNHVDGLDDLKQQIMLYGWKEMEDRIIQAVIGLTGYDAIRAMCHA
ncbi:MAG: TetR/AcrR family transcriptional regulator, partial [Lachnospiraceae bacterium]|nr:TetR/AcrR family transcriptional regulator [Lachnospiraceae bacterium]